MIPANADTDIRTLARMYASAQSDEAYYKTYFPQEAGESPWRAISILSGAEVKRCTFLLWYARRFQLPEIERYVQTYLSVVVSKRGIGRGQGVIVRAGYPEGILARWRKKRLTQE